jgi:hypothetical protein
MTETKSVNGTGPMIQKNPLTVTNSRAFLSLPNRERVPFSPAVWRPFTIILKIHSTITRSFRVLGSSTRVFIFRFFALSFFSLFRNIST